MLQIAGMPDEVPALSTLIDQQAQVVSSLQAYAAHGANGCDDTRYYGVALSAAIDKLATLEGLRHDKAAWRRRDEQEEELSSGYRQRREDATS